MSKSPFFRYGSVILLAFCLFRVIWSLLPEICSIIELQINDRTMRLTYEHQKKRSASPYIVHIDLDNQSVNQLPFDENDPRLYTELIRTLKSAGVKTILVDMVFPYCREDREILCSSFAREINKAGNVFFPVILSGNSQKENEGSLHKTPDFTRQATWNLPGAEILQLEHKDVTMSNFEGLNIAAAGLGHINSLPDQDGVYRRLPLLFKSQDGYIVSLAISAVSSYLGVAPGNIRISGKNSITFTGASYPDGRTGDLTFPIDSAGRNRIHFNGIWNTSFGHYSFATIIKKGATSNGLMELTDDLEDTIAIVSDVSTGSRDFGPIPLSSYFPLSGLHSHFINSILENDFLYEADFSHALLLDILLILFLTIAAVYLRGLKFSLAAGILFGIMLFTSIYLFTEHRYIIQIVRPSISFILAVPGIMLLQFFEVQKKEQYVRGQLTHYFAPSLMEKILKEPELLNNVEKKKLTILFSDIVGFTSWSSTKSAEEIHKTLNHYFEEMAAIVFAHKGTIDKYMGDGLMVFFGDPEHSENHSLLAVQASIAMQKKTRQLRKKWEKSGGMPIAIRIGVHTGEVVVGNMGSRDRVEYTVIGSNVNLAQRLESNARPGSILISRQVAHRINDTVPVQEAGEIKAKGFDKSIPVFTVPDEIIEQT